MTSKYFELWGYTWSLSHVPLCFYFFQPFKSVKKVLSLQATASRATLVQLSQVRLWLWPWSRDSQELMTMRSTEPVINWMTQSWWPDKMLEFPPKTINWDIVLQAVAYVLYTNAHFLWCWAPYRYGSGNQRVKVGVAPLTVTLSDSLGGLCSLTPQF